MVWKMAAILCRPQYVQCYAISRHGDARHNVFSRDSNKQYTSIGSDNALVPIRGQFIFGIGDDTIGLEVFHNT